MLLSKIWPGAGRDIVLNSLIASPLLPPVLRWRALRAYGLDVSRSRISPKVWFGSTRVKIGRGTFVNYGCMFNTTAPITLGQNCDIGMNVLFVTSSHELGPAERRAGAATADPIEIGDGTWIGANAVILPGVTVGAGCVIAAGAVVVRDCDANGLYAGVPARKVRSLHEHLA